jgi:hypothetical protein
MIVVILYWILGIVFGVSSVMVEDVAQLKQTLLILANIYCVGSVILFRIHGLKKQ